MMKRRSKADKKTDSAANTGVQSARNASSKSQTTIPPRKTSNTPIFIVLSVCFGAVAIVVYRFYLRYGLNIILGHSWRDYTWTPHQWRSFIDGNNKTILIIGGPHRAGTTVIWNAITSHPDIVGFGDTHETGVDYSEGVLFQDVYPRFGVGLEYQHGKRSNATSFGGLGQYALLPEDRVHWTKDNKQELLTNPQTMSRLLNRFAPYWDQNKKFPAKDGLARAQIWVEKSPQNAVLSLFLEGVYNMPISDNGTYASDATATRKSVTKFLFVTRHPLANCYAQDAFLRNFMGHFLPFETYLKNYIQMHRYMIMDAKKMDSEYLFVRLEDFALKPHEELKKIFLFLGFNHTNDDDLDSITANILSHYSIDANPNEKYREKWCTQGLKEYYPLVESYNAHVQDLFLGYDLKTWCSKVTSATI